MSLIRKDFDNPQVTGAMNLSSYGYHYSKVMLISSMAYVNMILGPIPNNNLLIFSCKISILISYF